MVETSERLLQKPRVNEYVSIRRFPAKVGLESMAAHYVKQAFKPHSHDEYVIGIIEDGIHSVWCRGEHFQVGAGTVVTMNPGDVHHGGAGHETGWKQRMVYVSEEKMRKFVDDAVDGSSFFLPRFSETFHALPELSNCFAHFHNVLHSSPLMLARDVALNALMETIVGVLAPSVLQKGSSKGPDGRICDAIEYLREHVERDVPLDELCTIAGLRRRQTIEALKRVTGLPPHAYHLMLKINAVKSMLAQGLSPAEAAAQSGFVDQSHMARHFVATVGMTPGAYKQALG
jgi:AraC-like DNA-binding protein/quercetin dioxygenase-like cupin family protein